MNTLIQALLLALWAGLCNWDQYGPHLGFRKPLLASVGVGIILGDLPTAIICGAALELMWLGQNNIGAYVPPNVIAGTIAGASLAIMGGQTGAEAVGTAVLVGVPAAILVQQLTMFVMTFNITWVHQADKAAESGDFKKVARYHWIGGLMFFLTLAVPVFLACYIGGTFVEDVIAMIPQNVLNGIKVASSAIPAVGLAMLLTMMLKKNMWIFLVLGFVCIAYLKLPLLAVAMIGLVAAGIYDLIMERPLLAGATPTTDTEEGDYDL